MRPRRDGDFPAPERYGDYNLVLTHGCHYGVPSYLDADEAREDGRLWTHPRVLKAVTRAKLKALVDDADGRPPETEIAAHCEGYDLVRHGGAVYAVPANAVPADLDLEEDRRRLGVVAGTTIEEVRERILALKEAAPVEFAGWLPIYELMGNCGRHPQFTHTAAPPPGYRFTRSGPPVKHKPSRLNRIVSGAFEFLSEAVRGTGVLLRPLLAVFRSVPRVGLRARGRLLAAVARLFFTLRRGGGKLIPILRFLRSRNYPSQLLLADYRGLVFLTSAPFTYNQNPWFVEIEDPTTLFFPHIHNGQTSKKSLAESPYFPIVKALLETDQCRGILTHMRSTARMLPTLFGEKVARKVHYAPLGVKAPARWQRHEACRASDEIHLLYINSWSQHPGNFHVRGGLDVLEAFATLRVRYPQLRLTLRTGLPPLDDYYHHLMESGWVRVIQRVLSPEEMESLHAESHIFLLPAARVHIVSLLQAMAAGLAVVASDGWGMEEYLDHERNGLIVKGRYGKTSWADERVGMLRETYVPTYTPDAVVVDGLIEAVSRLVEDHELRRRLGRAARRDVETKFSLESWNEGLKTALDKAVSPSSAPLPGTPGRGAGGEGRAFPLPPCGGGPGWGVMPSETVTPHPGPPPQGGRGQCTPPTPPSPQGGREQNPCR